VGGRGQAATVAPRHGGVHLVGTGPRVTYPGGTFSLDSTLTWLALLASQHQGVVLGSASNWPRAGEKSAP